MNAYTVYYRGNKIALMAQRLKNNTYVVIYVSKRMLSMQVNGYRRNGRPKKTWMDLNLFYIYMYIMYYVLYFQNKHKIIKLRYMSHE